MLLNHVGVANRTVDQAVSFYGEFLGLEKTKETVLASELTEQLFSVREETRMLVFEGEGTKVEVFITDSGPASYGYDHFGLYIESLEDIRVKAEHAGVEFIEGRYGEKIVCFLKDFSGNLIEIKQKP